MRRVLLDGKTVLFGQTVSVHGYCKVCLTKDGKRRVLSVHRLVALAFIPNTHCKPHINHIDGVKTNNHMSNLEWCTPGENVRHAYQAGLITHCNLNHYRGADHYKSKPVVAIDMHGNHLKTYASGVEADRALGVSAGMVCSVLTGRKKRVKGLTFKYADI